MLPQGSCHDCFLAFSSLDESSDPHTTLMTYLNMLFPVIFSHTDRALLTLRTSAFEESRL